VSLTLLFSEPVKFNVTGMVKIRNATGYIVGTINMTKPLSTLALVENGTQIGIPDRFLAKGKYIVQVPKGVITDLADNPAPEVNTSFTCLAGDKDTNAPVVVMADPANNATGVLGSVDKLTVWFSEDVEKASWSGSITVRHQSGNPNIAVALQSSNVSVSGSKVVISLPPYSLNRWDDPGLYYLQLPAGGLRDKRRGLEGGGVNHKGINGTSFPFQVHKADSTKPTIHVHKMIPANEGAENTTYGLPISQSIVLTFSEVVQASTGAMTITSKYDSPNLTISMSDKTQVMCEDSRVVVNPGVDLMPGEAYMIAISEGAVKDVQDNAFAGLAEPYGISTRASLGFKLVMSDSFQDDDNAGRRFGSGGAVDAANRIFVLGGVNASQSSKKTEVLNDVWRLVTNRAINCASSFTPKSKCNEEGGKNATVCKGLPPTLGAASSEKIIWRAPDARGTRCLDDLGVPRGGVGEIISKKVEPCPCPFCISHPPGKMPENMVDSKYVLAYTNISAAMVTLPIRCKTGYVPSGNFTCGVRNQYIGAWVTPYPQCAPAPCESWPAVANAGVPGKCGTPDHGVECEVKCNDGYRFAPEPSPQKLKCSFGKVQKPICMKKAAIPVGLDEDMTKEIFIVRGELKLDLAVPEGMTSEELSNDKEFQKSVKEALVAGLDGSVDPESVLILSIEVDTSRRLDDFDEPGGITARRLAGGKLKVLYMITVEDEGALADVLGKLNDPEGGGFAEMFTKTLEKKAAENGFKGFKVKAMVALPPQTEVKIVEVSTTKQITFKTTAQPSNMTTTLGPLRSNGSMGSTEGPFGGVWGTYEDKTDYIFTTSPKPEPPPPSLEGDNIGTISGGVVGALVGVLLVGGIMTYIKKKRKQKKIAARNPDAVVPFDGSEMKVSPRTDGDTLAVVPGADPAGVQLDPVTPFNAKKSKGQKVKAACAGLVGCLCLPCSKCKRRSAGDAASDALNAATEAAQNLSS